MVKHTALLAGFCLLAALVFLPASAAVACIQAEFAVGICIDGSSNGDHVTVIGDQGSPGSGGSGAGGGTGTGGGSSGGNPTPNYPLSPTTGGETFYPILPEDPAPGASTSPPPSEGTPAITLHDIATFRPTPGVDRMQPNGWMVVGLDTNFYAEVGVQVVDGQLLGRQAQVRFTPVRYHWSFGDGGTLNTTAKGATWAAQRLGEFDRTPTSHIYRASGTYFIDLSIDFAPEYRYDGGAWRSISGTINLPANRLQARAGTAKTVLVDRDCTQGPGPGC